MVISHRIKVKSQCDWGLGRQYLSLGEDLAKGFRRHSCLVRPPAITAISSHVKFLWFPTTYTVFTLEDSCFKCCFVWLESECAPNLISKHRIRKEGLVCICSGIVIHQVQRLFLYLPMWQKYSWIRCVLCREQSWSRLLHITLYAPHLLWELLISVSLQFD